MCNFTFSHIMLQLLFSWPLIQCAHFLRFAVFPSSLIFQTWSHQQAERKRRFNNTSLSHNLWLAPGKISVIFNVVCQTEINSFTLVFIFCWNRVVKTAYSMLAIINCDIEYRTWDVMLQLNKSLVRPNNIIYIGETKLKLSVRFAEQLRSVHKGLLDHEPF